MNSLATSRKNVLSPIAEENNNGTNPLMSPGTTAGVASPNNAGKAAGSTAGYAAGIQATPNFLDQNL